MTSERRAYVIVTAGTLAGICFFGQSVKDWDLRAVFGIIGAGAAAFLNGMAKSPRDGALADAADPEPTAVTSETDKVTTVHAESSDQEEHV